MVIILRITRIMMVIKIMMRILLYHKDENDDHGGDDDEEYADHECDKDDEITLPYHEEHGGHKAGQCKAGTGMGN